jgi:hypothetical protein
MWWKYYIHMYENGKIIPVETVQGIGGGGWGSKVEGAFKYDIFDTFSEAL